MSDRPPATDPGAALPSHDDEPHVRGFAARLNWLRAGVLGANDGIVSTAGLVVGVAGASAGREALLIAGVAGLVAGALSMAGGEYVSVSTQRDAEQALLDKERRELAEMPEEELHELQMIYQGKGLTPDVAAQVARQLTDHDALGAHAEVELGIDPDELTSPMAAAVSSLVAFAIGAMLPLLAIVLPSADWRVQVTVASVTVALVLTGWLSARLGGAPVLPAVVRNVAVGLLAMGLTFLVGVVVGPGIG
ncbi:VIT1/CCC1 transporter family protein [Salsipaludibacter albus]|uniref:VIT1/CCC1 transporter family protein n=1 Tax=Salsipaludibacter albus TaxID=2849650 RepID=UPI001EE3E4EF|nr:VIT family protein [Salsipaludibacter albus]MBY5164481.1 VIT family protein [Salsipaludibacter albus]